MGEKVNQKNSWSSNTPKQDSAFKLRRFSSKDNNDEELQQSPDINFSKFSLPITPPFPNTNVQRQEEDAPMSIGASESNYSSESYNTTQWAGMTSSYAPMSVAVPVPNYSAQSPQSAGTTNEYTPTSSSVPSESGKKNNSEILEAEKELAAFEKELAWELSKVAVDAAGMVDPTPISDAVGASMSLAEGDLVGAGLSLISIVPYVGDALGKTAKGARAAKKIAKLRKKIAVLVKKIKLLDVAKATDKARDATKASNKAGSIKNTKKASEEVTERGVKESNTAAKKAAELPTAIVQAQTVTKTNDVIGTPVVALIGILNTTIKAKYSWLKYFEARPRNKPGHYSIHMIASDNLIGYYNDVPSIKEGEFTKWFNSLTPDEFDEIWSNTQLRNKIKERLRSPGGKHEWHLVARANIFKRWGVSAEQIDEMRTLIKDVKFINPKGKHGGKGSTTAHNELLSIIDSSLNYKEFVRKLQNWAHYRLPNGVDDLPSGLQP